MVREPWLSASAFIHVRLGDLQRWMVVMVRCSRCSRMVQADIEPLRRGRPADTTIGDLRPKMRCTVCGGAAGAVWIENMER